MQVEEGGRYSPVSQPMVVFPSHLSINTDPRAGSVAGSAVAPNSPAVSSPMSHESVEEAVAVAASAAGSAEGAAEAPDSDASFGAGASSVCGSSFSDGSLVNMEEAADYDEVGSECRVVLCDVALHALQLSLPCPARVVDSQVGWIARPCCAVQVPEPVMQVVMLGQVS